MADVSIVAVCQQFNKQTLLLLLLDISPPGHFPPNPNHKPNPNHNLNANPTNPNLTNPTPNSNLNEQGGGNARGGILQGERKLSVSLLACCVRQLQDDGVLLNSVTYTTSVPQLQWHR